MDFDVESQLAAVERSVSSQERDLQLSSIGGATADDANCPSMATRAITLSRAYATTVGDLWDAVTNGERIPRWFLPISGDLEPDGRYQLEGNAGGTITECEPLSRFALTWEFGEDVSWVDVRLSNAGDGHARLTLTHVSRLSEHWNTYGPGAAGVGWELGLMGLALHVAHPTEPKPDEMAFFAAPEGKALITGSSEAWGEAAIAAGTDPDAARASARRTTAFYTGEG